MPVISGLKPKALEQQQAMLTRRFPTPWTLDNNGACFIVRDR